MVVEAKEAEAANHPDRGELEQHLEEICHLDVKHGLPTLRPSRSISRLERTVAAILTIPKMMVEACGEGEPDATKMETE